MEEIVTTRPELEKKYDEICGVAYVNLFTLSKNQERIVLSPFDPKNKEHMFLACVAKGLAGISEKDLCVATSRYQVWKMNKGIDKECRYVYVKKSKVQEAIDPQEVLDFMRPWASQLCEEENFDFGKIYEAFYKKEEKGRRK